MPMPSHCAAWRASPIPQAPSTLRALRRSKCGNWPRHLASAFDGRRGSRGKRRRRDGSTMPSAWLPSLDRRGCRSSVCSIGPPTDSRAGWPVTASRRTMRCVMVNTETAGQRAIVPLRASEACALCPLSKEAGWNQVAGDWRLMLTLGQGFGRQAADGRWIGSALTLPLGPTLAWISMVLVTKSARGKGLGSELLARCLALAQASGRVAGPDGTEFGRPIYLPLGFVDAFALARWHCQSPPRTAVEPPPGVRVRAATPDDLAEIIAYDRPRSGFGRDAILADLFSRSVGFAQVARRRGGDLHGFVLGRDGDRTWPSGPGVAA